MGLQCLHFGFGICGYKKILFVLSSVFLLNVGFSQSPLAQHRWEDRLILLFAPDSSDVAFHQQFTLLTAEMEKVTDRDLVFYKIFTKKGFAPDDRSLKNEGIRALRARFEVPENRFAIILIGKDGMEKLRRWEVTKPKEFFDLIDTMPMRRAEMRRENHMIRGVDY